MNQTKFRMSLFPGVNLAPGVFPEQLYEVGREIDHPDGIIVRSTPLDESILSSVRGISRAGDVTNNIPVDAATKAGVVVFNTKGANAEGVAELVFFLLGLRLRNLIDAVSFARSLKSETSNEAVLRAIENARKNEVLKATCTGHNLEGMVLGLVGLGHIGTRVAEIATGFRMRVKWQDPYRTQTLPPSWIEVKSKEELVDGCHVVSVHVPPDKSNMGLISEALIKRLQPSAILINTSRQGVCDEEAVVEALQSGELMTYAAEFPTLRQLQELDWPQFIPTPHIGASTVESQANCVDTSIGQMRALLELGHINGSVNFEPIELEVEKEAICRLVVVDTDVPNMIGQTTTVIGGAGLNLLRCAHGHGRTIGTVGYTLLNIAQDVPEHLLDAIRKIDGVLRVYKIRF
jgi:D-3-phosphoglycerate dehydrogenase